MSIEDKFNAAVNVIRGLPKNGSYQPSNGMMLKFYSYFKQATKGKCEDGRPAFWDVVSRAKYDAWLNLGDMPKEVAMQKYVDELKKIVETMSYTDNVANFMGSINELENVSVNDLELVAPDAIQKVRSRPNSPFASRDTSPTRSPATTNGVTISDNRQAIPSIETAATIVNGYHQQNGHTTDQSDDEYIDTVDDSETETTFKPVIENPHISRNRMPVRSAHISREQTAINAEVAAQLARTVERMNVDLQQVNNRINIVERSLSELRVSQQKLQKQNKALDKYPNWWPFNEISPKLFVFIILWPYIANRLAKIFQKKKL